MTARPPRGRRASAPPAPHVRANRKLWERQSDAYDRRCAAVLGGRYARAWGLWRVPESRLRLLGRVRGRDVLELGCGAARWSIALAQDGARVVGLDVARSQLAKARALVRHHASPVRLVRANAELIPFSDASFDLVLSDWGAMTFCDPHRTVPEVARVLRAGGELVFATLTPFRAIAHDRRRDRIGRTLQYDYFGLGRLDYPGEVNFALSYADWVRLFRQSGFEVTSLVETRAPADWPSPYLSPKEHRWGRRWPLELLWKVTKRPAGRRRARDTGAE